MQNFEEFKEAFEKTKIHIPPEFLGLEKKLSKAFELYLNNFNEERTTLKFLLLGEPKAWSRAAKNKTGGKFYDSNTGYKSNILDQLFKQYPEGFTVTSKPVSLLLYAYKSIPKTFLKNEKAILAEMGILRPNTKPDIDNYAKNIQDALNTFFYGDDSQVIDLDVKKFYSFKPRIELEITF